MIYIEKKLIIGNENRCHWQSRDHEEFPEDRMKKGNR